jgi:hypothetical protein
LPKNDPGATIGTSLRRRAGQIPREVKMDEKLANALADHIVCQSLCAFGAATSGTPVSGMAIAYLRARYRDFYFAKVKSGEIAWSGVDRRALLGLSQALGRYAANLANGEGATSIELEHVQKATEIVECRILKKEAAAGRFCSYRFNPATKKCEDGLDVKIDEALAKKIQG